jgi:hypothetical protein
MDRSQPNSVLCDTLSSVSFDGTQVVLPFDPDEIIDNLRLERYPSIQLGAFGSALKSVYYWFRPFMGRSMRRFAQKFRAGDWRKRQFPQWPVDM